jgi:hypothetical protein
VSQTPVIVFPVTVRRAALWMFGLGCRHQFWLRHHQAVRVDATIRHLYRE